LVSSTYTDCKLHHSRIGALHKIAGVERHGDDEGMGDVGPDIAGRRLEQRKVASDRYGLLVCARPQIEIGGDGLAGYDGAGEVLEAGCAGVDAVGTGCDVDEDVVASCGGEGGLMEAGGGLRELDPGVADGGARSIKNAAAEDSGDLGIGGGCAGESQVRITREARQSFISRDS